VGAASGRLDALAFMAGLIAGVWAFAEAWIVLEDFTTSGALESATLADLAGLPFWALALALAIVALATFRLIAWFEARRRAGG
jgi:hypothetical protein